MFKEVVKLIKNKHHLNLEGLKQIINIKASMILGLSDMLKSEFDGFVPVCRPIIDIKFIPEANLISGFVSLCPLCFHFRFPPLVALCNYELH